MIKLSSIVGVLLFAPLVVLASDEMSNEDILSVFESVVPIETSVSVPTVVEVPVLDPAFRRADFAVYEETTRKFQPALYHERVTVAPVIPSFASSTPPIEGNLTSLSDQSFSTYVEFPVTTETDENSVTLSLSASKPITATGFTLGLAPYVSLPRSVEVSSPLADGTNRVVLAKTAVTGQSIRFPKTTASKLVITLRYTQPLRIAEFSLFDEDALRLEGRSVRFLARPGEQYALYFRSDRPFSIPVGEAPNFSDDRDVKKASPLSVRTNTIFRPADTDGDGVRNTLDNCVNDANADQKDENNNGRGDACDDYDKDGVMNRKDNCPSHPNRNQVDTDRDGNGDACDGEESRFIINHPWLPWLALGLGVIVVVSLFLLTLRGTRANQ